MDADRWLQIQDVYLEAVERAGEAREAYLRSACAADPDLRAEVDSLLAVDGEHPVLDAGLDDLALLLGDDPDDFRSPQAPRRAGPYRILEEIGRGGMGTVYRAERDDDQYRREVALKVVRVDLADPDAARRFRRERQILAALEHANIARLYDGGVTDEGRPYLAMELVRGEPIHTYCDGRGLSVDARAQLFEQVCEAVEYAHRSLVVHRDLKPSNILVTEDGRVKLLDFGIAKLIGDDAQEDGGPGEAEPLTRLHHRVVTPEYASPEQVRGEPLSTASDVYSLGVVLHELLTGLRPEGRDRDTVTSPSTLVTRPTSASGGADAETIARARSTTPARLSRALQGELDTIVLYALRADPGERYPTATALREDLVRFRTGRPIAARAPTLAYRARKFLVRNRLPVGAGVVAVVALVGGLATSLRQARIAREERDMAVAVSGFMENLFVSSNPFQRVPERMDTLRIGAFLDRAVERLDTDLSDQPVVHARMQRILGTVHVGLGSYDRARELLEASVRSYRALEGDRGTAVAGVLGDLGRLTMSSGDPVKASQYYEEALDIVLDREGEESMSVALIRGELAGTLLPQQRLEEAETLLAASLAVRKDAFGEVSQEVAEDLNLMGALLYWRNELDRSIETVRQSLEMHTEVMGADHPSTATLAQNLGMSLNRAGRYEEAEPYLREAMRAFRVGVGDDHPNVGLTQNTLANVVASRGRWEEADSLFSDAVARLRRVGQGPTRDLGIALHDYAGPLADHGEYTRAETLLGEAAAIELALNPNGPGYPSILSTLGAVQRKSARPDVAEKTYRDALRRFEGLLPPNHPRVLAARTGLALCAADLGRFEEAEAGLIAVHEASLELEDGGVEARRVAEHLARFYDDRRRPDDALRWREAAGAG